MMFEREKSSMHNIPTSCTHQTPCPLVSPYQVLHKEHLVTNLRLPIGDVPAQLVLDQLWCMASANLQKCTSLLIVVVRTGAELEYKVQE